MGDEYAKQYEEEILGHTPAQKAKSDAAHLAARQLLSKLGGKLDALFSFHAAPKAFKPEATVRANVSAISMEEATPRREAKETAMATNGAKRGAAQVIWSFMLEKRKRTETQSTKPWHDYGGRHARTPTWTWT